MCILLFSWSKFLHSSEIEDCKATTGLCNYKRSLLSWSSSLLSLTPGVLCIPRSGSHLNMYGQFSKTLRSTNTACRVSGVQGLLTWTPLPKYFRTGWVCQALRLSLYAKGEHFLLSSVFKPHKHITDTCHFFSPGFNDSCSPSLRESDIISECWW